jgi:outer membrane receptor for ferrienterochelin and colicins
MATRKGRCWLGAAWLFATCSPHAVAQSANPAPDAREITASDLSLVGLLETDVVSASRSEQTLARAPAVIDVITQAQLRARGYRTVAEALQSLAGIDVISDHYLESVGVRGVAGGVRGWSRIVKVMIDGQPISFRPSGENWLGAALIPMGVIDRIEVIRGPASVLYGANAFLGVINIITKSGYDLSGNSLTLAYEAGDKVSSPSGEVVVAQQLSDFSLLLAASEQTRELDGYRLVSLPGRSHFQADRESETLAAPSASAFGRISYDSEHLGTLSLDGHFQRLYRSVEFSDWGVLTHDNRIELLNGYARLSYEVDIKDHVSLLVSGTLSRGGNGTNDHLNVYPRTPSHVHRDLGYRGQDLAGTLTYRLATSNWVSIGVDATWEDQNLLSHYAVSPSGALTLNPPAGSPTGERDFRNFGVFANTTFYPFMSGGWKALTGLGLTAGGRIDAHNIYGNDANLRAGLVYDVKERHFAKLLYGTAYRAPSSTQLYSNYIVPGGVVGNPDLRPERARTLELALGSSPLNGLTLRADGYYTVISDRVEIRGPSAGSARANPTPTNSTPIDSRGFELQLDYMTRRWDVFVSYSFQISTYEAEDILALTPTRVAVDTDAYPTHMVKGGATFTHRPWFMRAHVEGRYVDERLGNLDNNALVHPTDFLTNRYALPAYGTLDVGVSSVGLEPWRDHETAIQVKVLNVLDAGYVFPGYSGYDIPGFERSAVIWLRQEL